MRQTKIIQTKVINALSVADYEEQFNSIMREVATKNPTFSQDKQNPLLCFVYYELKESVAETLLDEFTLSGKKMQCASCPYFFMNEDRRMKARCLLHRLIIEPNRSCCEEYLEELVAKQGKPNKSE